MSSRARCPPATSAPPQRKADQSGARISADRTLCFRMKKRKSPPICLFRPLEHALLGWPVSLPLALLMGVEGLLPFVSPAMTDAHVSRFRGRRVAVDASCWLHRGAHAACVELGLGEETDRFIAFALRMVRMLLYFEVTPVLVFDGGELPMKERTRRHRHEQRACELKRALALHAQGNAKDAAFAAFSRAVTVTSTMARRLIATLREMGVPYVVAPFEADPQLAFLVSHGYCDCAISEDSDLLAYGCPAVLYKLDAKSGHGRLAIFSNLQFAERDGRMLFDGAWPTEWVDWERTLFADMCCLAGTDYLPGCPGIGVRRAHALLRTHRSLEACVDHALPTSVDDASIGMTRTELCDIYRVHLCRVRDVFTSSWVYDPGRKAIVRLHRPGRQETDGDGQVAPDFLGPSIPDALAVSLCVEASVDPITLAPVRDLAHLPPPVPLSLSRGRSAAAPRENHQQASSYCDTGGSTAAPNAGESHPASMMQNTQPPPSAEMCSDDEQDSACSAGGGAFAACAWGGTIEAPGTGMGGVANDRRPAQDGPVTLEGSSGGRSFSRFFTTAPSSHTAAGCVPDAPCSCDSAAHSTTPAANIPGVCASSLPVRSPLSPLTPSELMPAGLQLEESQAIRGASADDDVPSVQCTVKWVNLHSSLHRRPDDSISGGGNVRTAPPSGGGDSSRAGADQEGRVGLQITEPPSISESFLDRFRVQG
jgi:exonuclease-1